MTVNSIEDVRTFIARDILKNPDVVLSDDRHLIEDGLLNSIDIMRLINHLSESLGIQLEESDYNLENFETLSSIFALTRKRMPAAAMQQAS